MKDTTPFGRRLPPPDDSAGRPLTAKELAAELRAPGEARAEERAQEAVDNRLAEWLRSINHALRQQLEAHTAEQDREIGLAVRAERAHQRTREERLVRVGAAALILIMLMVVVVAARLRQRTDQVAAEATATVETVVSTKVSALVAEAFAPTQKRLDAVEKEVGRQGQESARALQAVGEMDGALEKLSKRLERVERRQGVKTPRDELYAPSKAASPADAAANNPRVCQPVDAAQPRDEQGWWRLTCREDDGARRPMRCRHKMLGAYSGCYMP